MVFEYVILIFDCFVDVIDWFMFLHPFGKSAVKDLDLRVAEDLEHPGRPIAPPLHPMRIIANDTISQLDAQDLHSIDKLFFGGQHVAEIGGHVFEVFEVEELSIFDMTFQIINTAAIACIPSKLYTTIKYLRCW